MSDITNGQNICPNCNTELKGEFCYECGQQRIHHPETVGHFVRHFFDDITHFDSKFFKSLIPLLFKPGFLTKEYMEGRRARYLHPIRAYLFLSFVYFLLFFSFDTTTEQLNNVDLVSQKAEREIDSLKNTGIEMRMAIDSVNSKSESIKALIDSISKVNLHAKLILDSLQNSDVNIIIDPMDAQSFSKIRLDTITLENYVQLQKTLPDSLRDTWFESLVVKQALANTKKYNNDARAVWKETTSNFLHNIPKVLFFLLPIFALLLKLLYLRRKIYYVSHSIFSLHYFSMVFILLTLAFIFEKIFHVQGAFGVAAIISVIYLYFGMRYFYGQGYLKTVAKLFVLLIPFTLIVNVALLLSLFISFLSL